MTALPTLGLTDYLASLPGRCQHGRHLATQGCLDCGVQLKAAGQARAAAARPDDLAKVEAAIRAAAATGRPFSANSIRSVHGVKGGVVGKAFSSMKDAGVIRPCGDETSTDRGTHGHRIFLWIGVKP